MTTHGATDLELKIAAVIREIMNLELYRVSLSDRLGAVHSLAAIAITGTSVEDDIETLGSILALFNASAHMEVLLDKIRLELLKR